MFYFFYKIIIFIVNKEEDDIRSAYCKFSQVGDSQTTLLTPHCHTCRPIRTHVLSKLFYSCVWIKSNIYILSWLAFVSCFMRNLWLIFCLKWSSIYRSCNFMSMHLYFISIFLFSYTCKYFCVIRIKLLVLQRIELFPTFSLHEYP